MDFFDYYGSGEGFKFGEHFLDVSIQRPVRSKDELRERFDIEEERSKFDKATYYVLDPFNNTYNPAKTLKGS